MTTNLQNAKTRISELNATYTSNNLRIQKGFQSTGGKEEPVEQESESEAVEKEEFGCQKDDEEGNKINEIFKKVSAENRNYKEEVETLRSEKSSIEGTLKNIQSSASTSSQDLKQKDEEIK